MPPERLAVLGDPIAHSLSPAMHSAALRAARIEGEYEAHHVRAADVSSHLRFLWDAGYRGCNVTIPHKETVAILLDTVSPEGQALRAVNTVVRESGGWHGYNTDVAGFARSLAALGLESRGLRAVIFGSGGAARAVAHALRGSDIVVVSRHPHQVVMEGVTPVAAGSRTVEAAVQHADLLVNATPLGMSHLLNASPLPDVPLRPNTVVIDLIYGHLTPFLRTAAACGCRTMDGLEMLVQQGAESFRLWFAVEPDLDAMRAACQQALREREERACSVS